MALPVQARVRELVLAVRDVDVAGLGDGINGGRNGLSRGSKLNEKKRIHSPRGCGFRIGADNVWTVVVFGARMVAPVAGRCGPRRRSELMYP